MILKMTVIGSHTMHKDNITIYFSMVLYWGFLIWGFSKPHLGIFYGSADFQGFSIREFSIRGFSIWGFSYAIGPITCFCKTNKLIPYTNKLLNHSCQFYKQMSMFSISALPFYTIQLPLNIKFYFICSFIH